jgi:hypothetical protein
LIPRSPRFTIEEVDLDDPDNYMGSKNLLEQAERLGCACHGMT